MFRRASPRIRSAQGMRRRPVRRRRSRVRRRGRARPRRRRRAQREQLAVRSSRRRVSCRGGGLGGIRCRPVVARSGGRARRRWSALSSSCARWPAPNRGPRGAGSDTATTSEPGRWAVTASRSARRTTVRAKSSDAPSGLSPGTVGNRPARPPVRRRRRSLPRSRSTITWSTFCTSAACRPTLRGGDFGHRAIQEIPLELDEEVTEWVGLRALRAGEAERGLCLVDRAQQLDRRVVLRHPVAAPQRCRAVVASAGVDLHRPTAGGVVPCGRGHRVSIRVALRFYPWRRASLYERGLREQGVALARAPFR